MIPVSDNLRARRRPYVNLTLIAVNVLVFIYELTLSQPQLEDLFFEWGAVPNTITDWLQSPSLSELDPVLTLVTSMFLHGGWLHISANMLFLWVFGDNVEDAMGHVRYLGFYLLVGILAGLAQAFAAPDSTVPAVGASGAIAGVMGAYLILYPTAVIGLLIPIRIPAIVLMVAWFSLQLLSGVAQLSGTAETAETGVAFWAHIGGFVSGLVLVWFFRGGRRSRYTRGKII